ncbi:MAG: DSD1 family PLP-dependent enzyme [Candidatus Melainabacteria bacterium]|nr:DSD1 family PLP-dependent enzyme [Candidatus Melainabacteria bacterium]
MNKSGLHEIDTPYVVVDLDDVEFNISRLMKRIAKFPNVSVRPHLKTAKSPVFAKMLLENGASGICVAKLSEAEIFAADGIDDILITTEIAGEVKIARLMKLLKTHPNIRVVVDNCNVVRQLNIALGASLIPHKLNVLIDLNVGQNRTGVDTVAQALELARVISEASPSINLLGIQGYEGHLQHLDPAAREAQCRESMKKLVSCADALRASGYEVSVVTTGGTGTSEICASFDGVTEVQPGSFIFMDIAYRNAIGADFRNALSVVATVVSKPNARKVVVDTGTKSLSVDMGHAASLQHPTWIYRPAGDEHGIIESESEDIDLEPGDRIHLTPSHIDTTVALHDDFCVVRGAENLIGIWPIATRGKVQ